MVIGSCRVVVGGFLTVVVVTFGVVTTIGGVVSIICGVVTEGVQSLEVATGISGGVVIGSLSGVVTRGVSVGGAVGIGVVTDDWVVVDSTFCRQAAMQINNAQRNRHAIAVLFTIAPPF